MVYVHMDVECGESFEAARHDAAFTVRTVKIVIHTQGIGARNLSMMTWNPHQPASMTAESVANEVRKVLEHYWKASLEQEMK